MPPARWGAECNPGLGPLRVGTVSADWSYPKFCPRSSSMPRSGVTPARRGRAHAVRPGASLRGAALESVKNNRDRPVLERVGPFPAGTDVAGWLEEPPRWGNESTLPKNGRIRTVGPDLVPQTHANSA